MTELLKCWYCLNCIRPLQYFWIIKAAQLSFLRCFSLVLALYCLTKVWILIDAFFKLWNFLLCWNPLQKAWIFRMDLIFWLKQAFSLCILQVFWMTKAASCSHLIFSFLRASRYFLACCCLIKIWSVMTEFLKCWYFFLCWSPRHDFCIIRAPHLSSPSCFKCFFAMCCLTEHCIMIQALFNSWNSLLCWYPLQVACISVAALIILLYLFCSDSILQFFWIKVAAPIIRFNSALFLCTRQFFWIIKVAFETILNSLWATYRRQCFWRDTAASLNFFVRILLWIS